MKHAKVIKKWRERLNLEPQVLATRAGMSTARLLEIEAGRNFSCHELAKIGDVLGLKTVIDWEVELKGCK